jgi:hypothetical protein
LFWVGNALTACRADVRPPSLEGLLPGAAAGAAYANLLAAPGDETALRRAADVCAEALSRDGSTFDGWIELGAKHAQLLGRPEHRRLRPSGELDDDGSPVAVRRHHPETPRRTRPRRLTL